MNSKNWIDDTLQISSIIEEIFPKLTPHHRCLIRNRYKEDSKRVGKIAARRIAAWSAIKFSSHTNSSERV